MPTACGLILIKRFNYRDNPDEEWSSKYWLTGTIPTSPTEWLTLADSVLITEKACYSPGTSIVRAYGYENSDDHSPTVWVHDYVDAGTVQSGSLNVEPTDSLFAGDQAGFIWWRTARRNSRGKWIYLRKFFHDGAMLTADTDTLSGNTLAAYGAHALKMMNGTLPNGRVIRSPAQDEQLTAGQASPWVTTRTLKRRGKRPPLPSTP